MLWQLVKDADAQQLAPHQSVAQVGPANKLNVLTVKAERT
jgi:hypothetical protein